MNTYRRTAVTTGALFLLAAASSIVGLLQYGPVLDHPADIAGGSAHEGRVASGALLELVLVFSVIGIPITVFPVLKKYSESLALGYVCFRLLEAVVITVGIISLLSVVTLGQEYAAAPASDAAHLIANRALITQHDWTFLFGPDIALGPSTLMMSFVLYRSRLVPRFVSVLGLVGGPLILVSGVLVLFGAYGQISGWGSLLALPVFCYEMTLAGWLLARGFDPAALASLSAGRGAPASG